MPTGRLALVAAAAVACTHADASAAVSIIQTRWVSDCYRVRHSRHTARTNTAAWCVRGLHVCLPLVDNHHA